MKTLKKDFKYKKIENFLTEDERNLLVNYTLLKHKNNFKDFEIHTFSKMKDTSFYADPAMESLMLIKKARMEKETNLKLEPTYSYWRLYTNNADLRPHKDRPSCEVSVTVMLGSSGEEWPIYMDGKRVDLKAGEAAVYLGCELEHKRDNFQGDWHSQVFLHYVDVNGPYIDYKKDKRKDWGEQKGGIVL
tara:strand:+ start:435 stop:1001 length:567 start_codon:yes stop_codon:yes gene_type:complete